MKKRTKTEVLRHPAGTQELRQDFARADLDRDGRINFDEFKQLLDGLEAGMSDEELHIGFQEIDVDRDGLIDCQEFITWWRED
jgi:Ca2+-binding EF-hand superfamily protein